MTSIPSFSYLFRQEIKIFGLTYSYQIKVTLPEAIRFDQKYLERIEHLLLLESRADIIIQLFKPECKYGLSI